MRQQFGDELISQTIQEIEKRYGQKPDSMRDYQAKLDSLVSELHQTHEDKALLESFNNQLSFITANNMYGEDEEPSKVFLTRLVLPVLQTLHTVRDNTISKKPDMLRYLILNVRDINLSNFLRFLGYWEQNGYSDSQYTKFASSLRIELIQRVEGMDEEENLILKFYVQFIYDDEVLKFPWCNTDEYLCPLDDFINYGQDNLIMDNDYINNFCQAKTGTDYIKMKK